MIAKLRLGHCLLVLVVTLLSACEQTPSASFVAEIEWKTYGPMLVLDVQPLPEDAVAAAEIMEQAALAGCDALILTTPGIAPDPQGLLPQLRRQYPNMILLTGYEWEVPARYGTERLTLLLEPVLEERLGSRLRNRFAEADGDAGGGITTLRWLQQQLDGTSGAALFVNFPNVMKVSKSGTYWNLKQWYQAVDIPINLRIDGKLSISQPVTEVGELWDLLHDNRVPMMGVLTALSNEEQAPCVASQVHVQVPEQSQRGIVQALRMGSFWVGQADALDDLLFAVSTQGMLLPAVPGEAISLTDITELQLSAIFKRGSGLFGSELQVEIISNAGTGKAQKLITETAAAGDQQLTVKFNKYSKIQEEDAYFFRMRVHDRDGNLIAYTNPVYVFIRQ